MPEPRKKPNTAQMLLEEIRELREAVDDLHELIDKAENKPLPKRAGEWFFSGMLRGIGVIIGTTVILALIVVGIRQVVNSEPFQNWVSEQIRDFFEQRLESIESATTGVIGG